MRVDSLFYIVFLGQIFLISYYLPEKLLARMKYVVKHYPPSLYPKLYPRPLEYYKLGHAAFRFVYRSIFALGFVILLAVALVVDHASFADDGYISEFWPMLYGAIQFIPLMLLEFSEFNQLKQMRQANTASTRRAELRPRRLFDYVSPWLFGVAVASLTGAMLLNLYLNDFVVAWENDTLAFMLTMAGANVFMAALGAWHLYGRRVNPHQSAEDRARQTQVQLQSLLFVSTALSLFLMWQSLDNHYDVDYLDAAVLSLYFQVVASLSVGYIIRSLKIEDLDFSVYKADEAMT